MAQEPDHVAADVVPAHFEVLDMSQDRRWRNNQFVTKVPHFRYYCGVPLRTENDINIGCLFVLDTKLRPALTISQIRLLTTCARNIMIHLETVKEAHDKKRAMHMNMCMAEFINPRNTFREHGVDRRKATKGFKKGTRHVRAAERDDMVRAEGSQNDHLENSPNRPENGGISEPDAEGSSSGKVTEADHQRAFDRAAHLLRESLDLNMGGGAVLFEAAIASSDGVSSAEAPWRKNNSTYTEDSRSTLPFLRRRASDDSDTLISRGATGHQRSRSNSRSSTQGMIGERVILAGASVKAADGLATSFGRADSTFHTVMAPNELRQLCQKFPKGKLFNLPEELDSSHFCRGGYVPASVLSTQLQYQVILKRQFPDAKQAIFVPMFHANFNRWTGCFVYTTSPYRVFSYDTDYQHTLAFCSAIRTEVVRLATMSSDQQKGHFIGSVSHELRSPLHGILASIEFLQDTECTTFQKSCIDTADACAQTLMDTVSMVVDYGRANQLRRDASSGSNSSDLSDTHVPDGKVLSSTNISGKEPIDVCLDCDLALITEEVTDGMAVAHFARIRSNTAAEGDLSELNGTLVDLSIRPELRRVLCSSRSEVETVLDIQHPTDWNFTTQPGAFRRIVMNLYGNSLKYTKHGYITVSLRVSDDSQRPPEPQQLTQRNKSTVKLIVTDTGQGISPSFLRNKVFSAFSQENKKAAGSGLGLSIVKSLVNQLEGNIDIKSILNVGTIVTVTFPMMRSRSNGNALSPYSQYHRSRDLSVMALKKLPQKPQVAIYEPALELDSFGQTQGANELHKTLMRYLSGWFHFPTLQTWNSEVPAKILVVDEVHISTLLANRPDFLDTPTQQSIILLAANPARQAIMSKDIRSKQVEVMCKPFGPYKLARTIRRALEKAATTAKSTIKTEYVEIPAFEQDGPSRRSSNWSQETDMKSSTRLQMPQRTFSRVGSSTSSRLVTKLSSNQTKMNEVSPGPDGGFPFPVTSGPEGNPPSSIVSQAPQELEVSPISAATSMHPDVRLGGSIQSRRVRSPLEQAKTEPLMTIEAFVTPPSAKPTSPAGAILMEDRPTPQITEEPPVEKRLLLVDDNKINLQMLHTYMGKKGFKDGSVDLASDGAEAVEVFKSQSLDGIPPAIVFMDISMPVMDGYQATRAIRSFESRRNAESGEAAADRALIVAITGNAGANDQAEAFSSGVDVYMTKPVSFKEVGRLLDNWRE